MVLPSYRIFTLLWLLLHLCPEALGQARSNNHKRFAAHVSVGYASNFYTKQFFYKGASAQEYNAYDKSGISYSLGVIREDRSRNRMIGLLVHSFSSRAMYSYDDTFETADSTYALITYVKNRRTHWYVGMPITWSVLKKNKKSPFFVGITCEPMIFLTSYLNEQRENNFEKSIELDFSRNLSTIGLMAACALGYRFPLSKKSELLITLNNQVQFFSDLNLHRLIQHRHNAEIGLTYSY